MNECANNFYRLSFVKSLLYSPLLVYVFVVFVLYSRHGVPNHTKSCIVTNEEHGWTPQSCGWIDSFVLVCFDPREFESNNATQTQTQRHHAMRRDAMQCHEFYVHVCMGACVLLCVRTSRCQSSRAFSLARVFRAWASLRYLKADISQSEISARISFALRSRKRPCCWSNPPRTLSRIRSSVVSSLLDTWNASRSSFRASFSSSMAAA
mmetsp:Transcript_28950/g.78414  ORF Transcript_28950/g.78414 Transcript_28950/m.78414 type:complete len:208 (+) Transcript_28950:49-672(+)